MLKTLFKYCNDFFVGLNDFCYFKETNKTITQSYFYPIQNEIHSSNISFVMKTFLRTNINSELEMQLIPKEICLCHSILKYVLKNILAYKIKFFFILLNCSFHNTIEKPGQTINNTKKIIKGHHGMAISIPLNILLNSI